MAVNVHTILEGARAAEIFASASVQLREHNPVQASELALAAATVSAAALKDAGALAPPQVRWDQIRRAIKHAKAKAWLYARGPGDFSIDGVALEAAAAALSQILLELGLELAPEPR